MSTLPTSHLTPEEYLAIERQAERKSEYWNGEMFLMAGASEAHGLIAGNAATDLHRQFRSRPCTVFISDMRVCVDRMKMYAYPDVVAICGEREYLGGRPDTLLNPTLIVEVLSPSTEGYDRGLKFQYYRAIESLQEYLLISSDRIHADLFIRQPGGQWAVTEASSLEETIELRSVGATLKMVDLYDKVEF